VTQSSTPYDQAALDAASREVHMMLLREGSNWGTKACEEMGRVFMTAYRNALPSETKDRDAIRYRAWRDGDVVVRRSMNGGGWEARHSDSPNWDVGSWHWRESLDEAIDEAMKDGGPL